MAIDHVSVDTPIKVYPDGSMWCALWGDDLQSGFCGFGRSPESAIKNLCDQSEFWALTPHATYEMICQECGHQWVAISPYPTEAKGLECPKCSAINEIEQDIPI